MITGELVFSFDDFCINVGREAFCCLSWGCSSINGKPEEDTLSRRRYWLWVTGEEYYRDLPPAPNEGWDGTWTCHAETREGDLSLLYRKSPESNIAYIFQVVSDAYSLRDDREARDKGWQWACEYKCIGALEHPLAIGDMRDADDLSGWNALRRNFQGSGGTWEVPEDVWRVLIERMSADNPIQGNRLELRIRAIEGRLEKESELEDWIIADDLESLRAAGFKLKLYTDKLTGRTGRQFVCRPQRWRIDLLCTRRRLLWSELCVVELKRVPADRSTFGQITAYMGWVSEHLAGPLTGVRGLVISDGKDESFDYAYRTNPHLHWLDSGELIRQ